MGEEEGSADWLAAMSVTRTPHFHKGVGILSALLIKISTLDCILFTTIIYNP